MSYFFVDQKSKMVVTAGESFNRNPIGEIQFLEIAILTGTKLNVNNELDDPLQKV